MKRRELLLAAPALVLASNPLISSALDLGGALGAATDAAKAASLTDEEVRRNATQMAAYMDRNARIAAPGDAYGARLAKVVQGLTEDAGRKLNFKVYLTKDVNAFAMADGSIRFYSGLMDMMTDDELHYVMGHEMGHVFHGHTKARMQVALASGAAQKGLIATSSKASVLADSQLGDLIVKVVRAQHSQDNERAADDYAMQFMRKRKYDAKACVTALEKLVPLSGNSASWTSTHPSPKERAARMRKQLA